MAEALKGATAAGEWAAVAKIAGELEARRQGRAGTLDLAAVRAAKRRKDGAT